MREKKCIFATMLKASNIHKSFHSLEVLRGIDVSIEKSEIVSIIGSSGAGKTTLLQILGTIEKADIGELCINDIQVSSLSSRDLSRFRNQHIGFVFQFHQLLPEFTALENICLPAYIANNRSKKEIENRAYELLDYLSLRARADHKPAQLSGGEQQRIAVARALMNQPDILFADEPSGNLDSQNASELHQLFLKLRADFSQTFVIVTHNEELAKISDRRLKISDGILC
jgi:lipoprotein-releasing system ATP-binding protein